MTFIKSMLSRACVWVPLQLSDLVSWKPLTVLTTIGYQEIIKFNVSLANFVALWKGFPKMYS